MNDRVLALLLALMVLFALGGLPDSGFISLDDGGYVTENVHVRTGLSGENILWAFTSIDGNWFPLTWMSHMVDCELFHLNPAGHHATNLLLHLLNTLLLFYVLKSMSGASLRSAFVAALFAVHPLHVESVAWVSERKDVLSTMFGLLTMIAYARYARDTSSKEKYAWTCVLLLLGLLSNPLIVILAAR